MIVHCECLTHYVCSNTMGRGSILVDWKVGMFSSDFRSTIRALACLDFKTSDDSLWLCRYIDRACNLHFDIEHLATLGTLIAFQGHLGGLDLIGQPRLGFFAIGKYALAFLSTRLLFVSLAFTFGKSCRLPGSGTFQRLDLLALLIKFFHQL